ncbi:MAG: 23S rRNA (pseudouridine(1915)-N(3))-methyltransferase RlmH [Deferribacteraceae bacterium]|jgi:23S rRNA (pseudouridine1915-N3)-methyltransferase|nr:23S rRNA (pseudouridine(1915)-N(3))-methyltransferase RlmH [Deferribacteraceae bacterium]
MFKVVVVLEGKSRNIEAISWFYKYAERLSYQLSLAEWGSKTEEKAEKFFRSLKPDCLVVTLDAGGKRMDSIAFAEQLYEIQRRYRKLYIFIGEADGHSETVVLSAKQSWSLSELTFPYDIALIALAEQLYRAQAIKNNHPYHK